MYLNTHTYYSLRYGTISPVELLALAKENGLSKFAITDINNTSACLEILREAPRFGMEPVFGIDFRKGIDQKFIAIAKNNEGFQEINEFLTSILHQEISTGLDCEALPDKAPVFQNAFVIYPFKRGISYQLSSNEFIGIAPTDLDYIRLKKIDTSSCVILQPATFRNKKDFNAHRLLRAIDENTLLSKLPESEQADPCHKMISVEELKNLYEEFPEVIRNTEKILDESHIYFDFSEEAEPQNQKYFTGSEKEDLALLEELCQEGLEYRYPQPSEEILRRVKKEIETIKEMKFVSYFLMNWDIVREARERGFFYVGRGSGANSIISYLLRITDVDPVELDLYFERFINLYRKNPPDFDIDFSWRDRDEMTEYIFQKFDHVALVATYNTFKVRSVRRELGKVF